MDDDITLSTTELQVISELDSQLFGFVKLNEDQHAKKKAIAKKAIQYLERVVVQAHLQESKRKDEQKEGRQGFVVDPKTSASRNIRSSRGLLWACPKNA